MPHGNVRLDRMRRCRHFTQMLLYDGPKAAPNPRRVRIYLAEKGIDVPRREIALIREEIKLDDQAAKAKVIDYPVGNGKTMRIGVIDLPTFYVPMDTGAGRRPSDEQVRGADGDGLRGLR